MNSTLGEPHRLEAGLRRRRHCLQREVSGDLLSSCSDARRHVAGPATVEADRQDRDAEPLRIRFHPCRRPCGREHDDQARRACQLEGIGDALRQPIVVRQQRAVDIGDKEARRGHGAPQTGKTGVRGPVWISSVFSCVNSSKPAWPIS